MPGFSCLPASHPVGCVCGVTRRGLLLGGAAAALARPALAQASPARIDTHHHVFPPFYLKQARSQIYQTVDTDPSPLFAWTPEKALAQMDAHGVKTGIASLVPGVWFGDVALGRSLARQYHDYAAQLCADHPGRFGFFASLPLPDVAGSLAEIAYAFDTRGADGVMLVTSYDGKYPGDPTFDPVFAELNRRRTVVFFHPTTPACCASLVPGVAVSTVEFLFDSTRAILSLMTSGTMGRYPDIRFIFAHTGGGLGVTAHRVAAYVARHPDIAARVPGGAIAQFGRLHYDIANSTNPSTMAAIRDLVPVTQLVFGSDYPVLPLGLTADGFDRMNVPDDVRAAINRGNAATLFPRFA